MPCTAVCSTRCKCRSTPPAHRCTSLCAASEPVLLLPVLLLPVLLVVPLPVAARESAHSACTAAATAGAGPCRASRRVTRARRTATASAGARDGASVARTLRMRICASVRCSGGVWGPPAAVPAGGNKAVSTGRKRCLS